ncbi:MAG TPA: response regulator [Thermoanaerobaculia bacterium]
MPGSVLIVDGDESLIQSLRGLITDPDIVLDGAAAAAEANSLLDQRPYCGMLLALTLRDGSGLDVLRHLAETHHDVPAVILVDRELSTRFDERQVKLLFAKPLEPRVAAAVVKGLCGVAA